MKRTALIFLFALLLAIPPAFAANCANPVGVEGKSIYNHDFHVYQFCNGTNWIAFNAIDPVAGGGGCSNPAGREATVIYNADNHILQYCDGTYWESVGGGGGMCPASSPPAGSGFLVATNTRFDGNLGGLAGANAKCLTELTVTNTGWWGYATANARGQLIAAKVFAFLCDDTTCNNLQANTAYYYANTHDDSTGGGGSFTTNGSGQGPGDFLNWTRADRFATIFGTTWWAGRATGSATLWSTGAIGTACTSWTTNNAGVSGRCGANNTTTSTRWQNGGITCNTPRAIMCFVNP